MMLHDGEHVLT